jgi:putative ABC transport system ATP-binding protein
MINVSNLSYAYNAQTGLRFPDFEIKRGEASLLLGESGSGKTTLLHLVGGLLRNFEGTIQLDGTNIERLSESTLDTFRGQKIGFIFQRNHLISALSVEKNLKLAPYLAGVRVEKERIKNVLDAIGLSHKQFSKVTELSQGQAQRVSIARAVIHQPPIILADEPTSALDDSNCEKVISLLLEIAKSHHATLLVATHDQRLKSIIPNHIQL